MLEIQVVQMDANPITRTCLDTIRPQTYLN